MPNGDLTKAALDNQITVGRATSNVYPWPQQIRPWDQQWPRYVPQTIVEPREDYANEIEVERGEHDAVIRFYRTVSSSARGKRLIKEITIPIGLLDWLQSEACR